MSNVQRKTTTSKKAAAKRDRRILAKARKQEGSDRVTLDRGEANYFAQILDYVSGKLTEALEGGAL